MVTVTAAITAAFAKVVIALAVMFNLAALFTDTQWSDIQSFLNFVVLLLLYNRSHKTPGETVETLTGALNGSMQVDPDRELRGLLAETVVDAMEMRRKAVTGATRATDHRRGQGK